MCAVKKTRAKSSSPAGMSPEVLLGKLKSVGEKLAKEPRYPVGKALEEQGIVGPLLFLSAQHVRVKRLVGWLRENIFFGPSAFVSHFGVELSSTHAAESLCADLTSLSLFSANQLLVVYESEKIGAGAQTALIQALSRASSSALLVLSAESIPQKAQLLQEVSSRGTVVELTELSGSTLDRWIEKEVSRVGVASGIAPEAKQLLIRCYGGDVSRLASEIEKLSLLVVPGEPISRNLVESISLQTPEVTSFELVKQVAARNPLVSVALANDLIEQGLHPLQVSAFLSRAFRTILGQKEKNSSAPLPPELNNPWFARQLGSSVNSFSLPQLKSSIARLSKLDFQLKDSGFSAPLALSLAVQEIAARR